MRRMTDKGALRAKMRIADLTPTATVSLACESGCWPVDTLAALTERGLAIIDGGRVIPGMPAPIETAPVPETTVPWVTIEDRYPRWVYSGFETRDRQWNASGARLTFGYADCSAEISFEGTA